MATQPLDFNPMTASPLDFALDAEGIKGPLADLARSVYHQESGSGSNTKTSNAGARGGMQIIPETFASVADKGWSIDDPVQNARGGVRYLKQLYDKTGGDGKLTAIGYYGGPGAIEKARKGIAVSDPRNPNAPNTFQYGDQIMARVGQAVSNMIPSAQAGTVRPPPQLPAIAQRAQAPAMPTGKLEPLDFDPFAPTPQELAAQKEQQQADSARQTRIKAGGALPIAGPLLRALDIDPLTAVKATQGAFQDIGGGLINAGDWVARKTGLAVDDPKQSTWTKLFGTEPPLSLGDMNRARKDFDAEQEAGPDGTAYKVLKEGNKIAATWPVGGLAGKGIQSVAELNALKTLAPSAATWLGRLGAATETGGASLGANMPAKAVGVLPRTAQIAANLGTRSAGGAANAVAQSAAMGDDNLGFSAGVGAALPPALKVGEKLLGAGVGAVRRYRAPQASKDAKQVLDIAGFKTPAQIAEAENILRTMEQPGAMGPTRDTIMRGAYGVNPTVPELFRDNAGISQLGRSLQNAGDDSLLRAGQAQNEARKAIIEGVAPTADNVADAAADFGRVFDADVLPAEVATGKKADKLYSALDRAAEEQGAAMTLPFDALNNTAKRMVGRGVVDKGQVPSILAEAEAIGKEVIPGVKATTDAAKDTGETLAQALRKNGGIRNVNRDGTKHQLAGEIDHVGSFTKQIVRNNFKSAKTIDDMADLMHQQGWLPDNDPNTLLNHLRDPDLANATKTGIEDPDAAYRAMFERGTMGDAAEHGATADQIIDKAVPLKEIRDLRSSMMEAAREAEKFGKPRQAAALKAMANDLERQIEAVADMATVHPDDYLPRELYDKYRKAQDFYADYQKRFHEGAVASAFKQGGDARPMREGAELAPHFFSPRGSAAQDIASLQGVAKPGTMESLKSYATTGLMSKQDAGGMLRPEEMKKYLARHSQALDALMTPSERWALEATRQSATTSNRALTFNKAIGSNTQQNKLASEAAGLTGGWTDSHLAKWAANHLPGGEFLRKHLASTITADKAERIGGLLADPGKLAEAVAAYRTVAGRAPFGSSVRAQAANPYGYRVSAALLGRTGQ